MSFKNLLTINAVIFLAFGIGFVLIPTPLISLYGADANPTSMMLTQLYGSLLIAISLVCWLSRGISDANAGRAIQLAFMVAYPINAIIHIQATASGVVNALGWSAVLIYLALCLGYAYFYFTAPKVKEVIN